MDLSTKYLGLTLKNPLVVSASPLSEDIGNIRRWRTPAPRPWCCTRCLKSRSRVESYELWTGICRAAPRASPSRCPTSRI